MAPTPPQPPAWAKSAIWYQIFVERFRNGDPQNNPQPRNFRGSFNIPDGWAITPWTRDWYQPQDWAAQAKLDHNSDVNLRRYGGDLQGVIDKLDYLQDLGVTALFFNPLNDAPSLHKYDARSYHHIDVNFGPDPAGDEQLIAQENPNDPATWRWTTADRLFLQLIQEVHRRKMRLILDYSWNHTGVEFWAWQDILKNQDKSAYKDWYAIKSFASPPTPGATPDYDGWAGLRSLPEIRKVDVTGARVSGYPYEGNLNPGAKAHILAVTRRWLAPDGKPENGLDGYRLDVADQIPMGFWRDYHAFVKGIKPDAYLVGEIWWQKWPHYLMNPAPYVDGAGIFDAVMFYQAYRPARAFFANLTQDLNAKQFVDSLQHEWNRLTPATRRAMMGLNASHDAPRLLTDFDNPSAYKYQATPRDNPAYRTGQPAAETYQRVRLYLLHQFTSLSAPGIWNGDELGMWGPDDPDCRKPLWWPDFQFDPETASNDQPVAVKRYDPVGFNAAHHAYYRQLIGLRKANPVLVDGEIAFTQAKGKVLAYRRFDKNAEVFVAFNLEKDARPVALPDPGPWVSLLDGQTVSGKVLTLAPLTGGAWKRADKK